MLAAVLLLAAGLLGGLIAGAPTAAAGGPPDDPGSQGQDQGKDDEKRPDHAGEKGGKKGPGGGNDGSSSAGDEGVEDEGRQDDGPSGDQGDQPPDDGDGSFDDEQRASDDPTEEEDQAPSADDEAQTDRSEDQGDDQEAQPLRERATTEGLEHPELFEGQAPLVAPLVEPAVPEIGQLVHLDAGAWDPDGQIVAIDWFLPDGTWLAGAQVRHVFELPGNHTLEVVATDDQGYTTTVTLDLLVLPATAPAQATEDAWASDSGTEAARATGTDADDRLRSNSLGGMPGGADPVAKTPAPPKAPDTDRPLGPMAVVAAFLVAAVALVARVE